MSEVMERLKKQADKDAEKCIRIYNALLDLEGSVWSSKWNILTTWKKLREPKFLGDKGAWGFVPTKIGEIFLLGIEKQTATTVPILHVDTEDIEDAGFDAEGVNLTRLADVMCDYFSLSYTEVLCDACNSLGIKKKTNQLTP